MDPYIVVCGAIKHSCINYEQVEQKLRELASMGIAKEAYIYCRETVALMDYRPRPWDRSESKKVKTNG